MIKAALEDAVPQSLPPSGRESLVAQLLSGGSAPRAFKNEGPPRSLAGGSISEESPFRPRGSKDRASIGALQQSAVKGSRRNTPFKVEGGTLPSLVDKKNNQIASAPDHLLPVSLDGALGHLMSTLAVEDWSERSGKAQVYESQLLTCEGQLRRLERLTLRLHPPQPVITAIAYELLKDTLHTLPAVLQPLVEELLRHFSTAIYSNERMAHEDVHEIKRLVGHNVEKVPHFVVARRQLVELEKMEQQCTEMDEIVDDVLCKRQNVIDFIDRLQEGERDVLMQWLFQFWTMTYHMRCDKMERMAKVLLTQPQDIVSPFMAWRLYVSKVRLEKWRRTCEDVDAEASTVANRITEVEIENEAQQKSLEDCMSESTELKTKCLEEQKEHQRLQQLWEATQPELLLSVLAQSLEFFFGLVMRAAHLSSLEIHHKLATRDVAPLLAGVSDVREVPVETLLVRWLNFALEKARVTAREQHYSLPPEQKHRDEDVEDPEHHEKGCHRTRLEMVLKQPAVKNLAEDLCDGGALCILFAVLKATKDGKDMSVYDLWPLDERDLDLRAAHLCSILHTFAPSQRCRCVIAPGDIVTCKVPLVTSFLASAFMREPLVPTLPERIPPKAVTESRCRMEAVLDKMESCLGPAAWGQIEDPSPLLHGGEDYHVLATVSAEQLLLRWTNVHLHTENHRPVENFGSDLQDGVALGLLLKVVAPEVTPETFPPDVEERLDRIVSAASRCTDFELLTVDSLMEGQSDVIASFLAQLFLSRPCLSAKPESLLAMHLRLLEDTCRDGYATLDAASTDNGQVMRLCERLEAQWSEITLAMQTVHDANQAMNGMNTRMRTFLGDTLAHRAHGHPRTMLDAKEARELLFYTSLNSDRLHVLGLKEIMDAQVLGRTEDLLKKHFRLLRDIFRYYSSTSPGGAQGITMEGILRLYHDCKLRSKELAPHHLESIFHEQMDLNRSTDPVLSPQNFIEVLLVFSNLKFRHTMDQVPSQFLYLVENHLQPYACQDTESIFQKMTFDPKVREVLESHAKELQIIFQIYAEADASTAEALQKVNTMNVKEFQMLLQHCEMLDELLTDSAVTNIFEGIQQSCSDVDHGGDVSSPSPSNRSLHNDDDSHEPSGLGDDDELAFSEFLDGLVAITAYKEPDPFKPFHTRVDTFIRTLFGELRRHWSRKRGNARVDALLNALQKKLKGADHKASVATNQMRLSTTAARMSRLSIKMAREETIRTRAERGSATNIAVPKQDVENILNKQRPTSASAHSPGPAPAPASKPQRPLSASSYASGGADSTASHEKLAAPQASGAVQRQRSPSFNVAAEGASKPRVSRDRFSSTGAEPMSPSRQKYNSPPSGGRSPRARSPESPSGGRSPRAGAPPSLNAVRDKLSAPHSAPQRAKSPARGNRSPKVSVFSAEGHQKDPG